MNYRFIVTPSLCTGCRTCELACAFTHGTNGKPGKSRIYPLNGGSPDNWVPLACLQCDDAACVKSCLVDALRRNSDTGAIELDGEKCVECLACVAACPFGCLHQDQLMQQIVKCDLCGGDPVCAHFCPTSALQYLPVTEKIATGPAPSGRLTEASAPASKTP